MKAFEFLKTIYNLKGKTVEWGIIEVRTFGQEPETEYKPGLYIKGSRVYVDLFARRLYSTVELPEIQRNIHPAVWKNIGSAIIALEAKDNDNIYVVLSKDFIADVYNTTVYGAWMEERLIL